MRETTRRDSTDTFLNKETVKSPSEHHNATVTLETQSDRASPCDEKIEEVTSPAPLPSTRVTTKRQEDMTHLPVYNIKKMWDSL